MKNNREFLNGVYYKAEVLQKEINERKVNNKKYYKYISIAAMIILIPSILFIKDNLIYDEIQRPSMVRFLNNPISYFHEADFIVIGQTKEIGNSEYIEEEGYIYTDIILGVEEVLLGAIEDKEIIVRVAGGKVKAKKVYSDMEGEFVKGNRSILFLKVEDGIYHLVKAGSQFVEVDTDIFIDELGNKYSLEDIKNNINNEEN